MSENQLERGETKAFKEGAKATILPIEPFRLTWEIQSLKQGLEMIETWSQWSQKRGLTMSDIRVIDDSSEEDEEADLNGHYFNALEFFIGAQWEGPLDRQKDRLLLISKVIEAGFNIHQKDSEGWQALQFAVMHRNKEVVSLLVSLGADINAVLSNGRSALHIALTHGDLPLVKWCVGLGIDIHLKDDSGGTAEDLARRLGFTEGAEFLRGVAKALSEHEELGSLISTVHHAKPVRHEGSLNQPATEEVPITISRRI